MVKHLDDKKVGELKFTPLEFETSITVNLLA